MAPPILSPRSCRLGGRKHVWFGENEAVMECQVCGTIKQTFHDGSKRYIYPGGGTDIENEPDPPTPDPKRSEKFAITYSK